MAAQYDVFGNYLGDFETEEERRQREEYANTAVSTQEIKTYGDGTVERVTKEEMPGGYAPAIQQPTLQPVQAVAPVQETPVMQPQVMAAVDPAVFDRMIQAESRGQQFGPNGQILTSPKGALGVAQIMPATAAQPGYGIKPATPEEIATKEGNLAFGQRYYEGMMKFFNNDQAKAAAAYNAGPGRVQQAERIAAQRGGSWTDYIPQETKNYLQQVMKGVGGVVEGMIPSAQAGTLPQPSAGAGRGVAGMPQAVPGPGVAVATGQGVQGTMTTPVSPELLAQAQTQPPAATQPPAPTPAPAAAAIPQTPEQTALQRSIDRYQTAQDNIVELTTISQDKNESEAFRKRAGLRVRDLLDRDIQTTKATKQAQELAAAAASGDRKASNTIAKTLQQQDGSWLKMILLGFISPELAGEEAVKLGFGNREVAVRTPDGKAALLTVNAKGKPLNGVWADGREMNTDEVINTAAFAAGKKPGQTPQTLGSPVTKTVGGELVNGIQMYDPIADKMYVQYGDKKDYNPVGWTSATQNIEQQQSLLRNKLMDQLRFVEPTKRMEKAAQFDQENNTNLAAQLKAQMPEFFGVPAQATGATGTTAPVTTATGANGATGTTTAVQAPVAAQAPVATQPPTAAVTTPPVRTVESLVASGMSPAAAIAQVNSDRKRAEEIRQATLGVQTKEEEAFVAKDGTKEQIGTGANDGLTVANVRRMQLDIVKNNPSIVNILNGQGTQYDRARRLIINAATGSYGNEEKKQLADELNQLVNKLTPGEYGALQEFLNMNTVVNAKTLRANAGPGAVSEAEQRANKEANIGNIDRIETYAALAGLYRSQFTGDLNASKQAFLASRPDIKTTTQWNTEWQKKESELMRQYQAIAKSRFSVMGKPPAIGASAQEMAAYKDRVFRAFEVYPSPTFNPSTNRWDYGTANARRAAMSAILGR
jgi:hypothetical protein